MGSMTATTTRPQPLSFAAMLKAVYTPPPSSIQSPDAIKGISLSPCSPSSTPPLTPSISSLSGPTSTAPSSQHSLLLNSGPFPRKSGWAYAGRLAWLGIGMIGPKSVIRQRLTKPERVSGFEGHPALIWRAPNEDGIVEIIPITSYDGKRAEEKWGKIRNAREREQRLQQLLMLEYGEEEPHEGTRTLHFTQPTRCRKRSYLNIQNGVYKIEVNCLEPYTINWNANVALASSSLNYVNYQLNRHVPHSLWTEKEENEDARAQPTSVARNLSGPWRNPALTSRSGTGLAYRQS